MLKSPKCIDGCKLVSMRQKQIKTQFRKGTWTLVCSHGIVMNEMEESHFYPDSVGIFNVPIQILKRTKSRGSAVKGKMFLFFIWIYMTFLFLTHYTFNIWLGTDAMASKDSQRRLIKNNKQRPRDPNVLDVRRTVSTRSPSAPQKETHSWKA